ncbi:hypothetical protein M080_5861, partial [Bacteroides fragilis str. 3397 T10]
YNYDLFAYGVFLQISYSIYLNRLFIRMETRPGCLTP